MKEKKLSGESWRVKDKQERSVLEKLLSQDQAKLIIAEFRKQGIDTPNLKEGSVFVDKNTGIRYASLPFRSSKTGQIHASLDSIDDFVQGVYVPLDEKTWETFTVVMVKKGRTETQTLPWSAIRTPGPGALLPVLAREKSFIVLKEAQREVSYRAVFLMGALQVAVRNPDIGYYMMIAMCAI